MACPKGDVGLEGLEAIGWLARAAKRESVQEERHFASGMIPWASGHQRPRPTERRKAGAEIAKATLEESTDGQDAVHNLRQRTTLGRQDSNRRF